VTHQPRHWPPGTARAADPGRGDTPGAAASTLTVPVFADLSGRRRRLLRLIGAGASVLCAGALTVVGVGLAGGPKPPFGLGGGAPSPPGGGHRSGPRHGGRPAEPGTAPASRGPGHRAGRSPSPRPSPGKDPSPSPRPSASGSPSSSPTSTTASPSPTASTKSPPGRSHSPSPHPHPSKSH